MDRFDHIPETRHFILEEDAVILRRNAFSKYFGRGDDFQQDKPSSPRTFDELLALCMKAEDEEREKTRRAKKNQEDTASANSDIVTELAQHQASVVRCGSVLTALTRPDENVARVASDVQTIADSLEIPRHNRHPPGKGTKGRDHAHTTESGSASASPQVEAAADRPSPYGPPKGGWQEYFAREDQYQKYQLGGGGRGAGAAEAATKGNKGKGENGDTIIPGTAGDWPSPPGKGWRAVGRPDWSVGLVGKDNIAVKSMENENSLRHTPSPAAVVSPSSRRVDVAQAASIGAEGTSTTKWNAHPSCNPKPASSFVPTSVGLVRRCEEEIVDAEAATYVDALLRPGERVQRFLQQLDVYEEAHRDRCENHARQCEQLAAYFMSLSSAARKIGAVSPVSFRHDVQKHAALLLDENTPSYFSALENGNGNADFFPRVAFELTNLANDTLVQGHTAEVVGQSLIDTGPNTFESLTDWEYMKINNRPRFPRQQDKWKEHGGGLWTYRVRDTLRCALGRESVIALQTFGKDVGPKLMKAFSEYWRRRQAARGEQAAAEETETGSNSTNSTTSGRCGVTSIFNVDGNGNGAKDFNVEFSSMIRDGKRELMNPVENLWGPSMFWTNEFVQAEMSWAGTPVRDFMAVVIVIWPDPEKFGRMNMTPSWEDMRATSGKGVGRKIPSFHPANHPPLSESVRKELFYNHRVYPSDGYTNSARKRLSHVAEDPVHNGLRGRLGFRVCPLTGQIQEAGLLTSSCSFPEMLWAIGSDVLQSRRSFSYVVEEPSEEVRGGHRRVHHPARWAARIVYEDKHPDDGDVFYFDTKGEAFAFLDDYVKLLSVFRGGFTATPEWSEVVSGFRDYLGWFDDVYPDPDRGLSFERVNFWIDELLDENDESDEESIKLDMAEAEIFTLPHPHLRLPDLGDATWLDLTRAVMQYRLKNKKDVRAPIRIRTVFSMNHLAAAPSGEGADAEDGAAPGGAGLR